MIKGTLQMRSFVIHLCWQMFITVSKNAIMADNPAISCREYDHIVSHFIISAQPENFNSPLPRLIPVSFPSLLMRLIPVSFLELPVNLLCLPDVNDIVCQE